MDAELCADVAAVGGDGMDRNAEFVGNFLVDLAVGYATYDVLLALTQRIKLRIGGVVGIILGVNAGEKGGTERILEPLNCGNKNTVLDLEVSHEVTLADDNVEENRAEAGVLPLLIVVNEDILKFVELGCHVSVIDGEARDVEFIVDRALKETVDVGEYHIVLVIHVSLDFLDVIVEKLDQQQSYFVSLGIIDGVDEVHPDFWQCHIEERGVGTTKVAHEGLQGDGGKIVAVARKEIADGNESVGVDPIVGADLTNRRVAEAEGYVKSADYRQEHGIVANEIAHCVGMKVAVLMINHDCKNGVSVHAKIERENLTTNT